MTIKAILFDMDGVLVDARDWHYLALNDALGHFGIKISRESHLTTYDGIPTKVKLELLTKTRALPKGLHQIVYELKQKYTLKYAHQYCKPTFNHRKALMEMKNKYKIGVCSNSIRSTIETLMNLSSLEKYIDLIVSNEDVAQCKPDPEMYLKAMKFFKVKPDECIILEDNINGIKAARASGAHLIRIHDPKDVTTKKIEDNIKALEAGK